MEDQLRFAVCYWHSFAWNGFDVFGYDGSFERLVRIADPWEAATRADAAFDFFVRLGVPYYCFHDRDVAPEGATPRESAERFRRMVDVLGASSKTPACACCGARPTCSATGASSPARQRTRTRRSSPRRAAGQMRRWTRRLALGGENYVLWGGREGYETLLNTDMKQELSQLGRFMQMVVEYKHRIGFKGTILIEPKPREPTKHQYDFDVATVFGFLQKHGLEARDQGQHRGQPRHARRATASSTRSPPRRRSASSARST